MMMICALQYCAPEHMARAGKPATLQLVSTKSLDDDDGDAQQRARAVNSPTLKRSASPQQSGTRARVTIGVPIDQRMNKAPAATARPARLGKAQRRRCKDVAP
jgi:hypothetical protein